MGTAERTGLARRGGHGRAREPRVMTMESLMAARAVSRVGHRVPWAELRRGSVVHIAEDGRYLGAGIVDGLSHDGSVLWVQFAGIEGRRMFYDADSVAVGFGPGRSLPPR